MMKQAPNTLDSEVVAVRVYPKSGRNAVEGYIIDAAGKSWLKVYLAAVPEDGKANKALLKLLAKEWNCAAGSLSIISGQASRHKLVRRLSE